MNYSVNLTYTAKQDLREIALWIADQSKDVQIAKQFVLDIKAECKRLVRFPKIGAYPKDRILLSAGYRFIIFKDYLIFYQIDETQHHVNIMSIFNSKKDYTQVLRKLI